MKKSITKIISILTAAMLAVTPAFQYAPAFAASSILVLMAIVILVIRSLIEHRGGKRDS